MTMLLNLGRGKIADYTVFKSTASLSQDTSNRLSCNVVKIKFFHDNIEDGCIQRESLP